MLTARDHGVTRATCPDLAVTLLLVGSSSENRSSRRSHQLGRAQNTNAADGGKEWIDDKALARMLDLSVETIQQWRGRDEGPPYAKLGPRAVRYRLADVRAWMSANVKRRA
jgi:predicted DNA-binding transcriptional regulator AlpA